MRKINPFFLTLLCIILIIIFTPIFGNLFEWFFGDIRLTFFWGPSNPEYVNGFFMSLTLFIILFLTIFNKKRKYLKVVIYVILISLFFIYLQSLNDLIINIGLAIIGWLLGEVILRIYKSTKQKKLKQ